MFRRISQFSRLFAAILFGGPAILAIIVVSELVIKKFVGLPIALLIVFSSVGIILLHVVLPTLAMIQLLVWLNRKLCVQS